MYFISQMLFQDRFKIISLLAQPLAFHSSGVSQQFLVVIIFILNLEDRRRVSLKSCPFSQRFLVLASCYPLELFHLSDSLFLPIRSISEVVFPFLFTRVHRSRRTLCPHISATVIQLSPRFCAVLFINSLSICSFASKSPLAYLFF